MRKSALALFIFFLFYACVPIKKMEEEQARGNKLQLENQTLMEQLEKMSLLKAQMEEEIDSLKKKMKGLANDTLAMGEKYRGEKKKNDELNKLYDDLVDQNKKLLSSSSAEKQALLSDLENQKRELMKREQDLNTMSAQLKMREIVVKELEDMLKKKDAAVADLKKRIEDALMSFNKDELSVEIRDGKIYVSLQEKLLFKSGSAVVDAKGRSALVKLGEVLARQTDVDILIEGHTDNVPISTATIKDNWDLSVARATAIVRILQENKNIKSERFIASGRGEYVPVAPNSTAEGKAKNRRTEIILAPKLDEIFKILEN